MSSRASCMPARRSPCRASSAASDAVSSGSVSQARTASACGIAVEPALRHQAVTSATAPCPVCGGLPAKKRTHRVGRAADRNALLALLPQEGKAGPVGVLRQERLCLGERAPPGAQTMPFDDRGRHAARARARVAASSQSPVAHGRQRRRPRIGAVDGARRTGGRRRRAPARHDENANAAWRAT